MAARCPPAEAPITPMRSGSSPYFAALARSHRIAALHVVDLRRPGGLAAQPVVDRGRGIIAALHQVGDLAQPHRLVARPERPAVDVHDHRQWLAAAGGSAASSRSSVWRGLLVPAYVMSFSTRMFSGNARRAGLPFGCWAKPPAVHASNRDGTNHRVVRLMALGLPLQGRGKVLADVRMCLILSRGRAVRQRGKPEMSRDSADVDPGAGTFVASPRGIDLSDHRGG